ncbi:MAG TPA: urease accessory protein UreD [Chthoniobacterales bacterium]
MTSRPSPDDARKMSVRATAWVAHPGLAPWKGELKLRFERREHRTVLAEQRHQGPLRVQKPLYPEGPGVCHTVLVHPPGGLVEGDELQIDVEVGSDAHAVLSTPSATKWYKGITGMARQIVQVHLQDGAQLDYLPQENLFFRQARATNRLAVTLPATASALGWESVMLGRLGSGERWDEGELRLETALGRPDGELLWTERALLSGTSALLRSPQGLACYPVFGTLWATGPRCSPAWVGAVEPALAFHESLRAGVTHFASNLLLVRAVARNMEILRRAMTEWWTKLRPLVHNVPAKPLRLWAT